MADPSEDQSSPLPVPKGSYNFNFEDFDESFNPFQSNTKLGQSPPKGEDNDPFKSGKKLSHSPPPEDVNPFGSKKKLDRTPPSSPSFENNNDVKQDVEVKPDGAQKTGSGDANLSADVLDDDVLQDDMEQVDPAKDVKPADDTPKADLDNVDAITPSEPLDDTLQDDPANDVKLAENTPKADLDNVDIITPPEPLADMLQDDPANDVKLAENTPKAGLDNVDIITPPEPLDDMLQDDPAKDVKLAENMLKAESVDANLSAGSYDEEWADAEEGSLLQDKSTEQLSKSASIDPLSTSGEFVTASDELAHPSGEAVADEVLDAKEPSIPEEDMALDTDVTSAEIAGAAPSEESETQVKVDEDININLDQVKAVDTEKSLVKEEDFMRAEEEGDLADSEGVEEKVEKKKKVKKKEKSKKPEEAKASEPTTVVSKTPEAKAEAKATEETFEEVKAPEEKPAKAKAKAARTPESKEESELLEKEKLQPEVKEQDESVAPPQVEAAAAPQDSSTTSKDSSPASSPKKKAAVKKNLKKPKSKLKQPQSTKVQNPDDENEIMAPKPKIGMEPEPTSQIAALPDSKKQSLESANQMAALPDSKKQKLESANQMAESLEMVHDFGAGEDGEMPEDDNEGFVPASDVFSDKATWEMLEKFGGDACKEPDMGRESLFVNFEQGDGELEEQDKARTGPEGADDPNSVNEDDLITVNTPPQNKSGNRQLKKHPAARVLEENIEKPPGEPSQDVDNILKVSPGKSDSGLADMSQSGGDSKDAVVQLVQGKSSSGQVLKFSQSDWNKMKQDMELNFQAQVLQKEKEWSKKLADREKKMSVVEENSKTLKQTNEEMRTIVNEFEKTISQLQAEKEKTCNASQQSLQDIVREKEQLTDDLHSVETAFSNLHQRYEKTKGVVEGFKQNEEVLKKCVADYQTKLKKSEQKLQALKLQAEEKLDKANLEIDKERKAHTSEMARLQAALKKAEVQIAGLDKSLEQKVKENGELTAICDELIAKVQ